MAPQEPFETSDLNLAALLRTAGVQMIDARRESPKRVVFLFERDDAGMVERLMRDFFNKNTKVDALSYSQEQKALKTLCFTA